MLKENKIPHVQGCLANEKRIVALEEKVLHPVLGVETAVENSKGAVVGTVNLQAQLALILHNINKMDTKIEQIKTYVKWLNDRIKGKF